MATWTRAGAMATLVFVVLGCRAKEDQFYAKVWPCNPGDSCGTNRAGDPMMCYPAHQLGAPADYCVDTCDPGDTMTYNDTGGLYACLSSGARFQRCDPVPNADAGAAAPPCPPGLTCMRTNILFPDVGLCMPVPVCDANGECPKGSNRTCAGKLLLDFAPATARDQLQTDHLYCVVKGCHSDGGTACPAGEHCLPDVAPSITTAPDICVPECGDGPDYDCPPGFGCAYHLYSKQSAKFCVPGVIGFRCQRSSECLAGFCIDTGAGFKQCSIPCTGPDTCLPFDSTTGTFACLSDGADGGTHCTLLDDFTGTACKVSNGNGDCMEGTDDKVKCFAYHPLVPTHGAECRHVCEPDGTCAKQGGVPMVCLAGGTGGCYPGVFGVPCSKDDECVPGYQCLDTATDGGAPSKICTRPCTQGCDSGYCVAGVCHYGAAPGEPCQSREMCRTKICEAGICG
jgi:hypothetical protein